MSFIASLLTRGGKSFFYTNLIPRRIKNHVSRFKTYLRISKVDEIARRYFVMNAFDGALTMLGVIMGTYISGVHDPRIIISAGIGGSLAMGISGFTGAYMTELAERKQKIKTLERVMLTDLEDSMIERASMFAAVLAATIDGVSPALAAFVSVSPFILSYSASISYELSFAISLTLTLTLLFILGVYLGRVSRENKVAYGALMLFSGALTSALILLMGFTTLSPLP